MTNRIVAFVLLCSALTLAWWYGLDWVQRTYGAVKFANDYLGDPTGDAVRLCPPIVIDLLVALAVGLFGARTSALGKFGVMLWSGVSPYFVTSAAISFGCALNNAMGNHGVCL